MLSVDPEVFMFAGAESRWRPFTGGETRLLLEGAELTVRGDGSLAESRRDEALPPVKKSCSKTSLIVEARIDGLW